jgi:Gas vesicle synthesis protein GvpL/GvpF
MATDEAALRRLRDALSGVAAQEAAALVREAQKEARARVHSLLTEALSDSMLAAVERVLDARIAVEEGVEPDEAQRSGGPTALYVFGVLDAAAAEALPESIAGVAVHAVREGELAAVVGEVPLAEYGEERLREHLADMAWVERSARRHEEVLEAIAARATVIPMRMCTVYEHEHGPRELLRREMQAMRDALAYLEGKSEWGVKLFCDPAALAAGGIEPQAARGGSGAEYMQQRLREREERLTATRRVEEAAARVHGSLCTVASDAMLAPPQRREVSGRKEDMVLNGVYLVPHRAQAEFHAQAQALTEELAGLGLELVLTGPWPAYNFVPGTIGAAW